MNWIAFLAMILQLATAVWALWLMGKTKEKKFWIFFSLAALAMLTWRVARWWELTVAPDSIPASLAWLDTLMGLTVTVLFSLGVYFAGGAMRRRMLEREDVVEARKLTGLERDKLQQLLERLPVGVVVEQEQGIVYVNGTFLHMAGRDESTVRQEPLLEMVAPEHRERLVDTGYRSSDRGQVMEVELVRPDGSRLWVAGRRHHVVWAEKPATVWVFVDISEHKAAEAQREAIFQLFSQGPVVLFRWRPAPERTVAFVTDNVRNWGFEPEQLLSDPRSFTEVVHPDDRERVKEGGTSFLFSRCEKLEP
ncbi:MAG: PAS domain S-box protein [Acidobacteriota bacterium]